MINKPKRNSNLKYSILKPSAEINSLKRCFERPHSRCGYELAQEGDRAIRRYKKNIESLEQTLQDCQWRHDEKAPIVHCLYVELLAPTTNSKTIAVEIYVEDLEVSLAKMKRIILPEAVYLILQAIEGFKALWERFRHVSVDEESFGLDCRGNCLAWLSSSLEKHQCEQFKLGTPHEIVREVISQVRSRSEPACQALLSKLLEGLTRREFNFFESHHAVLLFAKNHQIAIPNNLKYLVHQDRISRNSKELSLHLSIHESRDHLNQSRDCLNESREYLHAAKTPRFVPSRCSLQEVQRSPKCESKESSMCNLISTLRMTTGPDIRFLTCRSINHNNKSADSSLREEDSFLQFETKRKFRNSYAEKDNSVSSCHSRCKSQSYEDVKAVNKRPKRETETTRSIDQVKPIKRISGFSEHARIGKSGSFIDKFKKSDKSLAELATAKKLIHKSSNQMESNKLVESLTPEEASELQTSSNQVFRQSEPTIPKIPINIISPLQSSDPTFHVIPEPEEVIKANQWTTTVRNLLSNSSTKLKTSITEGQDTSSYLSDVRLDRLDTFSRQMVVSLIPEGSEKLLPGST